jgi:hypothetical protein
MTIRVRIADDHPSGTSGADSGTGPLTEVEVVAEATG